MLASMSPWHRRRKERRAQARMVSLHRRIAELQAQVDGLERVLDSLDEAVVAVDRSGIVVHVNDVALHLLGIEPERSLGHHMFAVLADEGVCSALEYVMRPDSTAGDDGIQRELELERGLGERVLLTVRVRPLRKQDSDQGGEGAIAVLQDVTDLRRLERARADFFTNVSHELKTPVTAIRGLVETMLDDEQMELAVRRRFLDKARHQCARLAALVGDLLALSRLESDPGTLNLQRVSLRRVVCNAIAATSDAAERMGVEVSFVDRDADVHVCADEDALAQAISNLVTNAVAWSASGQRVEVAISVEERIACIRVTDRGEGIERQHLERIFERFYRVDPARSRERGGTGIGLSIVKHVMIAHGGEVEVASRPGHGSTFSLRLPLSEGYQQSHEVQGES